MKGEKSPSNLCSHWWKGKSRKGGGGGGRGGGGETGQSHELTKSNCFFSYLGKRPYFSLNVMEYLLPAGGGGGE